jgi:hypothetical protein
MLLFKPEHVQPILDGIKTQTRRDWKTKRVNVGSVQKAKTQMLSKVFFAKLHIKRVWQEHLLDISEEDAKAEGGYTRETYIAKFHEINPKCTEQNPMLWCLDFEKIGDPRLPGHIDYYLTKIVVVHK